MKGIRMKRLVAVGFAAALCLLAGCASRGPAGEGATAAGGSGITVFGTVDAAVSGYKNR